MLMEDIIAPVDTALLKQELSQAEELGEASHEDIKVYCLDASFPHILREIGRLREIAFRKGGGGSGKECDLDQWDTDPSFRYRQLVVWDTRNECIAGGYRFVYGFDVKTDPTGQPVIPSAHIFHFSDNFMKRQMPHTMELSRSFIAGGHQRTNSARKSIFVLDCLFKGISVIAREGGMTDAFGKVTFYPDYPQEAFSLLTSFMKKHCCDGKKEIEPFSQYPVQSAGDAESILKSDDYRTDFRALHSTLLQRKQYLPPILKTYMNLTTTLRYYGSAVNDAFGNVVEMGLKVHIPDIDKERWGIYFKKDR